METRRQIQYQARYRIRQLKHVKTWQLLIILGLSVFVAMTFLRLNSSGMIERRKAVLQADQEARDADVVNRMLDLQHYVSTHMNTSTDQFYLQGQYERDKQRAIEAAVDDRNPNGNVNAKADAVCAPQFALYSPGYLQCFLDELNKYPSAPDIDTEVDLPNPAMYRHSFAAPSWSPDFAGFSVLFSIGIALIVLGRWLQYGLLALLLRLRHRGIGS